MKEERYKNRLKKTADCKKKYLSLKIMYKYLPLLMVLIYPAMLLAKGLDNIDLEFWLMLCIPAGTLVLITALRKFINRARPYEVYSTPPLFDRDGQGESFPSRHTASAFIIAMSGFVLNPFLGAGLLLVATAIGFTRYLSGVHFISDILAGAGISLVTGFISFIII